MFVKVCDVGPRDGLQNEATVVLPSIRADLVNRLATAGVPRIEAVSFVHPKLVPAMAGPEEVMTAITRRPSTMTMGLVLNEKGYDRAVAAAVDEIRYGLAVTDEFSMRNQNQSTAQGLAMGQRLIRRAHADGKSISVALSVCFGCPFAGRVDPRRVLAVVEELMHDAPDEISLADTIGVAVPSQVKELVSAVCAMGVVVGGHFHNTRNTGYANSVAALEAGATVLDSSVGGLGGCPFAPRATGNIATEDLIYMFDGMGIQTGIDLGMLIQVSNWLSEQLSKELPSLLPKAGRFDVLATLKES